MDPDPMDGIWHCPPRVPGPRWTASGAARQASPAPMDLDPQGWAMALPAPPAYTNLPAIFDGLSAQGKDGRSEKATDVLLDDLLDEAGAVRKARVPDARGKPVPAAGIQTVLESSSLPGEYRETFTMSGALDVLQMKEEDALKALVSRNPLRRHNLDFHVEQYICKRESDGIYIRNLKGTWEKHLLAALPLLLLGTPLMSVSHPPRMLASECAEAAAATGATPAAGRLTPGTITNQIQAACWESRLLIPELTTSLSQWHLHRFSSGTRDPGLAPARVCCLVFAADSGQSLPSSLQTAVFVFAIDSSWSLPSSSSLQTLESAVLSSLRHSTPPVLEKVQLGFQQSQKQGQCPELQFHVAARPGTPFPPALAWYRPAHLLHHPAVVLLSLGPIRAGSVSTATYCHLLPAPHCRRLPCPVPPPGACHGPAWCLHLLPALAPFVPAAPELPLAPAAVAVSGCKQGRRRQQTPIILPLCLEEFTASPTEYYATLDPQISNGV
ncbi:hypothetical protein QTO34_002952 [Cnephaeus nilssonii]|uniref:Uncharacterized protein n=1 Tax=Cnephaeus nilssonii TaxID=3371016 RepID=A0AA40LMK2_CNENI|nr:hypothetical protein QTO34_002952 [Eptesicus nilssonii]